jgi:hypothetical protein
MATLGVGRRSPDAHCTLSFARGIEVASHVTVGCFHRLPDSLEPVSHWLAPSSAAHGAK